ncbi:MAG: 16S rRNA (adenine(1518)-N(6)/adenine(1519)-N(6))-dimethyltransferase RsmA [Bacteroidetes bacterium]|nr:16S rRNA (adenine(1518)-N(6)/adenine(1519)-N(6))-dimethyltransferase RsmA [Bacteroidota bacterium]MCL6102143.1 16S rRNA (adenine(1518)-N(6)/adenine(1519)-N(6))-dimethyltransferase RsmA [Bacteroidota bacterium]
MQVRAKKGLGQHFLRDHRIASDIVDALAMGDRTKVLEVGPGMGVLTRFLLEKKSFETTVVEIDRESVSYLKSNIPELEDRIIEGDFLQMDLRKQFTTEPFSLIGNFPYNISSQILFKVLDNRNLIPEVVGMLQKEVAERICTGPGSKTYGILSVLLQAWYKVEYLFTVNEEVFDPPPKVKSAVIRLSANGRTELGCNEKLFKSVVKQAFNQRRKMLRNSIKSFTPRYDELDAHTLTRRPEQLSVEEFIRLTNEIEKLL